MSYDVQIAEIDRELEDLEKIKERARRIRYFESKRKVWMPRDKLLRWKALSRQEGKQL